MKYWLVVVALVCAMGAQGQGWMRTYGGAGNQGLAFDQGYQTACQTADGGIMMTASVESNFIDSVTLMLIKTDHLGNVLIEKTEKSDGFYSSPYDSELLPDGGFVVCGKTAHSERFLMRLDSELNIIWKKIYPKQNVFGANEAFKSVVLNNDGSIVCTGFITGSNGLVGIVSKIDANGNEVWDNQFFSPFGLNSASGSDLIKTSNGDYLITGTGTDFTGSTDGMLLIDIDSLGQVNWLRIDTSSLVSNSQYYSGVALSNANDGNYIVIGKVYNSNGFPYPICKKIDGNGNLIWEKAYGGSGFFLEEIYDILPIPSGYYILGRYPKGSPEFWQVWVLQIDEEGNKINQHLLGTTEHEWGTNWLKTTNGTYIICGTAERDSMGWDALLMKTDSLGNLFSSALTGTIHHDPEPDCLPDPTETGFAGWLVQATGAQSFATLTDSLGNFILPVDTGSYEVTVAPPGPYWEVCNSPFSVDITAFYDTTAIDFPAQAIEDCPYLTVDISAPFLRRCFDNDYYVHYCNDGTVTANDASVEVTLDPYFTYVSSTIPLASQNGNVLTFDLGDVAVGDCGSFQITAYLDCDSTVLGQTHCTSAHITPDSLCLPPDPLWDGSSIEVDVSCNGDSVVFTLTNVGMGGMSTPLGFIIIEDQIVLMTGDFQLGSGQSTTVTAPSNGTTLHLEAQQAAAHPSGFASTGSTIEGCGGWMSLGFFTQWSFDDDPDPFTDVDCQANIGSYDPNDKTAFPTGFTEEHLIEPGQEIEYLIRFQNTGTDTAFKVTVVDVLPTELDLVTVRPGASSHPYTYGVTPEGWLTFTFDDIMLPDSNVNEAASHGFIRFRASQRPGLGWGNVIANTALIYFDFNAPVQTNTYQHRIGQIFPWTVVGTKPPIFHPKKQVRIVPNPLTDSALLQVEGIEPGPLRLVLTDVSGKLLRNVETVGTGFEFQRGELPAGMYLFQIERNGERVGSGKLMVR